MTRKKEKKALSGNWHEKDALSSIYSVRVSYGVVNKLCF